MGRLIDADELLNMSFSNGQNEDGILYVPFREVMHNIKNAPTAYDVEKVVAELEKLKADEYYKAVEGDRDAGIRNNAYANTIDIVKKGGIPAAGQDSESLKFLKYGEAVRKGIEAALKTIKDECGEHPMCRDCPIYDDGCIVEPLPCDWKINDNVAAGQEVGEME